MNKDKLVWRLGPDGLYQGIDPDTGCVVEVEKTKYKRKDGKRLVAAKGPGPGPRRSTETHHWVLDGNGKKIWVPKGTDPGNLPRVHYPYSEVTCDHILQAITEGKTIKEIGETEGFPPAHVIHKWLREHNEFKAQYKNARSARAEWFADTAIQTAREADKEEVHVARLQVDTYKWAAEVNDPETYGKRTKVVGDPNAPVAFIVDTGIRRDGDEGAIETTAREVEASDDR